MAVLGVLLGETSKELGRCFFSIAADSFLSRPRFKRLERDHDNFGWGKPVVNWIAIRLKAAECLLFGLGGGRLDWYSVLGWLGVKPLLPKSSQLITIFPEIGTHDGREYQIEKELE